MLTEAIDFADLLLAALLVGTMFGMSLILNPAGLAAGVYITLQQQGIRTLNRAMPGLGAVTTLLTSVAALLGRDAGINEGRVFRRVKTRGGVWGDGITPKAICYIVKAAARRAGLLNLAPHGLRRTCARLCYLAGGELEQIQFLLGHVSIQTTERYLGCEQKLRHAVNDQLGLEGA